MRRIEQEDLNAAQRALGMATKSRVQLQNIVDHYSCRHNFADKVIAEAAQQMLTAKSRMGMFAGEVREALPPRSEDRHNAPDS